MQSNVDEVLHAASMNKTLEESCVNAVLAERYHVIRQLGQGGMGSVWLAEDLDFNKEKVAIKMLPSILVKNKRAAKQLKEEALHWKKLSHPNIATMRNYVENDGNPFLVVDYIEGTTLEDYLVEKGKLGEGDAIRLLKPIADALDYAHRVGVIHRDVKPANIMIRKDGSPFVLDFGIAREMHETMTRVTGALSSGTLMYMSPEQLHGADPSPKQDIYAFAAMTYECLTGAPPFNRGQIEYQIEHDMPKMLDRKIAIAQCVMSGLSKDADRRPPSCAAILGGKTDFIHSALAESLRSTFRALPWVVGGLLLIGMSIAVVQGIRWKDGNVDKEQDSFALKENVPESTVVTQEVVKVVRETSPVITNVVVVPREVVVTQVNHVVEKPVRIQHPSCDPMDENGDEDEKDEDAEIGHYRQSEIGKKILQRWVTGDWKGASSELSRMSSATKSKDPDLLFVMGQMCEFGLGMEMDRDKAEELYRKAMALGSLVGKAAYGLRQMENAAGNMAFPGSAQNQYAVAFAAAMGLNPVQNEYVSGSLVGLQVAASNGDAVSALFAGMILNAQKDPQGVRWIKKASELGSFHAKMLVACSDIDEAYRYGNRAKIEKGINCLERFAQQGVWMADALLIVVYKGLGNLEQARVSFNRSETKIRQSAQQGERDSQTVLNLMQQISNQQNLNNIMRKMMPGWQNYQGQHW